MPKHLIRERTDVRWGLPAPQMVLHIQVWLPFPAYLSAGSSLPLPLFLLLFTFHSLLPHPLPLLLLLPSPVVLSSPSTSPLSSDIPSSYSSLFITFLLSLQVFQLITTSFHEWTTILRIKVTHLIINVR